MGEHFANSQTNTPISNEQLRIAAQLRIATQLRIAALERLAGSLAHDFNNLFTAIIGQASLAMAFVEPESQAYYAIDAALTSTQKAIELAEIMQLFAGRGHVQQFTVNLNDFLTESKPTIDALLPQGTHLSFIMGKDLPPIKGDRHYLIRLLTALVTNSVEAILPTGTLSIFTDSYEVVESNDPFSLYVGNLEPGRYVRLTVQDDGSGMTQHTQARLFEPFHTTKGSGRGLGLAEVLGIVKGHNGGIWVNSAPGRGCTVSLILPIQQAPQNNGANQPSPLSRPVRLNKKTIVLAIEDDQFIRLAISDILEEVDIRVMSAINGLSGITLYEQFSQDIDLVLLALALPDIDGVGVYRQLRQINETVKVIVTSGHAKPPDELSHLPFLTKPYRADELITIVQSALGG